MNNDLLESVPFKVGQVIECISVCQLINVRNNQLVPVSVGTRLLVAEITDNHIYMLKVNNGGQPYAFYKNAFNCFRVVENENDQCVIYDEDVTPYNTIKIKLLELDAKVPTFATPGSACFDIYAHIEAQDLFVNPNVNIMPYSAETIGTGIAVEIPEGYVLLIYSRSGHGFNHGIRLGNCVGVIDSDYRGELKIRLQNDSTVSYIVNNKDRIAQGMLIPVPKVRFEVVNELSQTVRGEFGLGSTGE